jgi:hypothetical protein
MRRAVVACVVAVLVIPVAAIIYLRIAHVPIHDIEHEFPLWYTPEHPRPAHAPLTPALARAARRAQFDHAVNPVPELGRGHWLVSCGEPMTVSPDSLFIQCYPSLTDCAVLYRCTPDGKLLWKSFDNRSP